MVHQMRLARVFLVGMGLSAMIPISGAAQTQWKLYTPKDAQKPTATASETVSTNGLRVSQTQRTTAEGELSVRRVSVASVNGRRATLVDEETETHRIDAHTERVVRRIYGQDPDGRRVLVGVEETVKRELPDKRVEATTTYSQRDVNGRLMVARREVAVSVPSGPEATRTETTVFLPGPYGGLAPAVRFQELDRRAASSTQVVRTRFVPDGNGRWVADQRTEAVEKEQGASREREEKLYTRDANGALSLTRRIVERSVPTAEGERDQKDVYQVPPGSTLTPQGGTLTLWQRVTTVKTKNAAGEAVTRQEVAERSLVAPADGLHVTGAVIEVERADANGTLERRQTILADDGNQRLREVVVFNGRTSGKTDASSRNPQPKP